MGLCLFLLACRYAFDPRKMLALQIHRPEVPHSGGADISADVARFNRFPELYNATALTKACARRVSRGARVEWWVRDDDVAVAVERLRRRVRFPLKQLEDE